MIFLQPWFPTLGIVQVITWSRATLHNIVHHNSSYSVRLRSSFILSIPSKLIGFVIFQHKHTHAVNPIYIKSTWIGTSGNSLVTSRLLGIIEEGFLELLEQWHWPYTIIHAPDNDERLLIRCQLNTQWHLKLICGLNLRSQSQETRHIHVYM